MFEWLLSPEALIALFTLTALEIVLGIDNIVLISILVSKLPPKQRQPGRIIGLTLAMVTRILLLLTLSWMIHLTEPLFELFGKGFSGRDLILFFGGLFLVIKSTNEIREAMTPHTEEEHHEINKKVSFLGVLIEIALLDIVFSLDSVITAVGIVNQIEIMVTAIIIAVGMMMFAAKPIGDFVENHPTFKILALAFLILIGATLIIESFSIHVPKAYIYCAMGFSVFVEILNTQMRKRLGAKI
ncbi:TerC family protein [Aggregatibacter actinomycetemcomitans]|uniref:TerC family protein n=1 Tax=Aggregatibacter actinomycetemcomitans TaxID=714 RepID=UPI001E54691A|nr:TerC family protein [Aggregatibacter actinomycetemcomitans]